MARITERLRRLEASVPVPPSAAAPLDLRPMYRRLEAAGLARWDEGKGYWSPVEATMVKRLLAEWRGGRGA